MIPESKVPKILFTKLELAALSAAEVEAARPLAILDRVHPSQRDARVKELYKQIDAEPERADQILGEIGLISNKEAADALYNRLRFRIACARREQLPIVERALRRYVSELDKIDTAFADEVKKASEVFESGWGVSLRAPFPTADLRARAARRLEQLEIDMRGSPVIGSIKPPAEYLKFAGCDLAADIAAYRAAQAT